MGVSGSQRHRAQEDRVLPDRAAERAKALGRLQSGVVPAGGLERSHGALLYEISQLLFGSEGVEELLPAIIAVAARALPLSSAIVTLHTGGRARTVIWQAQGASAERVRAAKDHAGRLHTLLAGHDRAALHGLTNWEEEAAAPQPTRQFIVLPLVLERRAIAGTLHLDGDDALDEIDLRFVAALVNHLAGALRREVLFERKQAAAEARVRAAEAAQVDAQLEAARAKRVGRRARDSQVEAERQAEAEAKASSEERRRRTALETWHAGYDRREREQRVLAEVGRRVASSLDARGAVAAAASCAVPLLADLCLIDRVAEDGARERVEVRFASRSLEASLGERLRQVAPDPRGRSLSARAIARGERSFVADLRRDVREGVAHDEVEVLRAAGVISLVVVPLVARGRALGALTLATAESARRYADADVALAEAFAERVATALDNARLYEEARETARAADELLGIVAHDLKHPLSNILLGLEALSPPAGTGERRAARQQLDVIRRSARRMEELIRDLLDTASIDAGKLRVALAPLEVSAALAAAAEGAEPVASKKAVRLARKDPGSPCTVSADARRLQQVFGNLLTNAIAFSPAGATITIAAEGFGDFVRFSVHDRGPGIPAADLPHVFERFWQARGASGGTGLGLSIVKAIVAAHGGEVWVESPAGEGCTFSFTVPIAHGAAPASFPSPSVEVVHESAHDAAAATMRALAHDLRNPLAALRLLVDCLQHDRDTPLTEVQQRVVDEMVQSIARLNARLNALTAPLIAR